MACITRRYKCIWSGGRRAASQRRCLSPQRGTSAQQHKRHIGSAAISACEKGGQ
jgi:hypothetical protein